jgi:hypothetical protein
VRLLLLSIFGWPAIVAFLVLATAAVWWRSQRLMLLALVFSLAPSLYMLGGNGWARWMALYVPLTLCLLTVLLKRAQARIFWPKLLLTPIYAFYSWWLMLWFR